MKKFLSFFCGRGAVWLYLSILAMAVCPTMVSVLAALIKGALLGETEVFFTKMAGSLIGWLFLCLAFGRALNEEYTHKTALRLLPRQLLNGILPMLVIYTAMQWFVSRTEGEMPIDSFVLLSAAESFLFVLALGRLAISSRIGDEVNLFPKGASVLLWVRHPLAFLAVYVSYGVSKLMGVLFDYLFSGSSFFAALPRQFLLCFVAAVLQWMILLPAYHFAIKRCFENPRKKQRKKQKDKAEHVEVTAAQGVPVLDEEKLPEPKHRLFVPALAASACSLVLFGIFIAGNLYNINNNPNGTDGKYRPYATISSIDAYLEAGDDAFSRNDMNAGDEKGALAFLEDFFPEVNAKEIESLHISLLHGEGKYDEALKEAQEFAEKYPDDIDNLGYLAVGMLPRDTDIAIDSALKLADIIKNSEDPEQISAADSAIGTFLEYIFSYYTAPNPQFCGFQYFYSKVFTDEQRQKLLDDPVMYDYLLLWQDGGGDLGSNPGSAIVQANKMLEQHPDLPYVLYIRGFNKVQGKLFEDAIPDLERSIELDPSNPFVRIELAVAYNGVGRYADALRVTEEMDEMLDDMGYHPSAGYVGFSYYINEFLYEVKQNMYETADGTAESAE